MSTDDQTSTPRAGDAERPTADGFVEVPSGDHRRGEALAQALARGETIAGQDFSRAAVGGRNLAGADLAGATLRQVDFTGAFLEGASFRGADLRRAVFRFAEIKGARFEDARLWGLEIDEFTFKNSGWSAERFAALHRQHQFQIEGLDSFPTDVRRLLREQDEGLILFLSARLLPWDQTMLHAFACTATGDLKTDVRVAEFTETGGGCRVRLVGSDPADLVKVAEHLAQVTWRTEQKNALQAAGLLRVDQVLDSLDYIREHLEKQELWAEESGVRETLEDQAESHIRKKDLALVRTWDQKLLRVLGAEVQRRTVGKLGGVIQGEVEDGVPWLLGDGGDDDAGG